MNMNNYNLKYYKDLRNLSTILATKFNADYDDYNYYSQFFIYRWILEAGSNFPEVID